jgi:hypothetical protein
MSALLKFKEWNSSISESRSDKTGSFNEWKQLLESKSGDIAKLVEQAKSSDSEKVKSTPGYNEIMDWYTNGGPVKGKATMSDDDIIKTLKYWNGDLSSKTSEKASRVIEAMDILSDSGNVESLMKKLQKAAGMSKYLSYDVELITKAASELKTKFEELKKAGKEIGQKTGEGQRYSMHTTLKPETYPWRLGIIPWSVNTEEGLDEYNGKDLGSANAKQFTAWYEKIKNDGVSSLIEMLDDRKYLKIKAMGMKDTYKITMLNKFTEKASKMNKEIKNALAIRIYPSSVKSSVEKKEFIEAGDPVIEYAEFKFPSNTDISKTFFLDDQYKIDNKYTNSISEFVSGIKAKLPEGAKVSQVTVKAVASTSQVPSTKYFNSGGNEKLVDLRTASIEKKTVEALKANGLADNIKFDKTGRLPNNGPLYDKEKYGKAKRDADPAVKAEYEKIYGEYRFSGVQIMLAYSIETPTTETTETLDIQNVGDWKGYIGWTEGSKRRKRSVWKSGGPGMRRSKGPGLYPTKPGIGCTSFGSAYG